ncbi:MAG: hypothetical protein LBJ82_01510, partial [Deltaproteobacteria bacterium]|nr:hypothetical protein [Deltaproteobacteria bacterium]
MNSKTFSQLFDIVYDKFIEMAGSQGFPKSNLGFSKFLGHEHDGRVRAWKGGQWPNAQDCWLIHKKLDMPLPLILTGQNEDETPRGSSPQPEREQELNMEIMELLRENRELRLRIDKLRREAGNGLIAPGGPGSAPIAHPGAE